jgi:sigma-B regulation protein RsbU (phosphoserine phosphatase)
MSNAGHMHPIIKDTKGTHEHEVRGATALGLMDGVEYPDAEFQLAHASSMIMYTDGISEAHDIDSEQYSDERLVELITTTGTGSSEEMGNEIINSVDEFAGEAEQFDDITVLIIHYE